MHRLVMLQGFLCDGHFIFDSPCNHQRELNGFSGCGKGRDKWTLRQRSEKITIFLPNSEEDKAGGTLIKSCGQELPIP